MKNKNILIGTGVLILGYLLWEKSQKDTIKKREENLTKNSEIKKDSLGMPQVKPATPEEEKAMRDMLLNSIPNEFTIKLSSDSNVNYYKGKNNEFYKQGYSTTGFSGMMPSKISLAEFSDAYVKFKNQPK